MRLRRRPFLAVAFAAIFAVPPVSARQLTQPADTAQTATQTQDVRLNTRPTPAGAFVRSLIVPGWGQAAFGAHGRGGFYFAARFGSGFMLFKTIVGVREYERLERRHVALVRDSLIALAAVDTAAARRLAEPGAITRIIDDHPRTKVLRNRIDARKQQREDWITWSIFWMLMGAADAYVTAHLADFPTGLEATPLPGGGARFGVHLPVGGGP